jgi:hypothetical protein
MATKIIKVDNSYKTIKVNGIITAEGGSPVDGGTPNTVYGGTTAIDGGNPSTIF